MDLKPSLLLSHKSTQSFSYKHTNIKNLLSWYRASLEATVIGRNRLNECRIVEKLADRSGKEALDGYAKLVCKWDVMAGEANNNNNNNNKEEK